MTTNQSLADRIKELRAKFRDATENYQALCAMSEIFRLLTNALDSGQLIPAPADYAAAYRDGARDMKERCALVARGFDGAINSKQNKAFVDAGVMWEVYGRDIAIAAAIDALPLEGANSSDGTAGKADPRRKEPLGKAAEQGAGVAPGPSETGDGEGPEQSTVAADIDTSPSESRRGGPSPLYAAPVSEAAIRADEREQCAQIAESVGLSVGAGDGCGTRVVGTSIDAAAAIRARGSK